ncbi:MAG TPA: hypothetical protein ENG73_07465 [Desulfobacterales bacterium]|nr:hypothetical protein [Desulfobacterales bacterium]
MLTARDLNYNYGMFDPYGYYKSPRWYQDVFETQQRNLQSEAQTSLAQSAAGMADFQLKRAREEWALRRKQAEQGNKLAAQFLSSWNESLKGLENMFGKAMNLISGSISGGFRGGSLGKTFDTIIQRLQDSYQDYKTKYAPVADYILNQAKQQYQTQAGAIGELQALARPDYVGARARAASDVAQQAAGAREAMQKQLLSYGIDPTSGKFGALTRRSYLDQAKTTALAENLAVNAEKERAAKLNAQIASLVNPSQTALAGAELAGVGTNLLTKQADVLATQADVEKAKTQAIASIANTMGNVARDYSQAVVQPRATLAGYFLGRSGGALPSNFSLAQPVNNQRSQVPSQTFKWHTVPGALPINFH